MHLERRTGPVYRFCRTTRPSPSYHSTVPAQPLPRERKRAGREGSSQTQRSRSFSRAATTILPTEHVKRPSRTPTLGPAVRSISTQKQSRSIHPTPSRVVRWWWRGGPRILTLAPLGSVLISCTNLPPLRIFWDGSMFDTDTLTGASGLITAGGNSSRCVPGILGTPRRLSSLLAVAPTRSTTPVISPTFLAFSAACATSAPSRNLPISTVRAALASDGAAASCVIAPVTRASAARVRPSSPKLSASCPASIKERPASVYIPSASYILPLTRS